MQTAKAQATAQRIADAAAELFARHGFDNTTIGAVAESAQVAPGTVMLHFGTKSQLATAAFADQIRDVVEASRRAAKGASVGDELAQFVRPIYDWYARNASFAPDLLREALFSEGPWSQHYEQTVASTVAAFAEIVERHHPSRDTAVIAEGLLGDYLLVLLRSFRQTEVELDTVARFVRLAATRFE